MHSDGHMASSEWIQGKNHDEWYYVNESGAMVADTSMVIKGVTYYFDVDGKCKNPNG